MSYDTILLCICLLAIITVCLFHFFYKQITLIPSWKTQFLDVENKEDATYAYC
jgi:hypothetical protein